MIKLYSFGPSFGVLDPSPFVLKIHTYMRLANIEYVYHPDVGNLRKAPKGKLPFITDGETTISDSEFIISYLKENYKVELDSNLSVEQKSSSYLMGKSLDENLYWCLVYSRWAKEDSWIHIKKAFFESMPFPLKLIIPPIARKKVVSALKKQGLGKHSDDEINTIAFKTFKSMSEFLGDKQYFFGEKPCTFDATAFAFLCQFICSSIRNDMNEIACSFENLTNYCNNIKSNYY